MGGDGVGSMVCEHLKALDDELTAAGIEVVYRDRQPWSKSCRNWTRYKCFLDLALLRDRFKLDDCVIDWEFKDHWQGNERGFVCSEHFDAIIGDYDRLPNSSVMSRWLFKHNVLLIVTVFFAIFSLVITMTMTPIRHIR
jgi:hypothetical protein